MDLWYTFTIVASLVYTARGYSSFSKSWKASIISCCVFCLFILPCFDIQCCLTSDGLFWNVISMHNRQSYTVFFKNVGWLSFPVKAGILCDFAVLLFLSSRDLWAFETVRLISFWLLGSCLGWFVHRCITFSIYTGSLMISFIFSLLLSLCSIISSLSSTQCLLLIFFYSSITISNNSERLSCLFVHLFISLKIPFIKHSGIPCNASESFRSSDLCVMG